MHHCSSETHIKEVDECFLGCPHRSGIYNHLFVCFLLRQIKDKAASVDSSCSLSYFSLECNRPSLRTKTRIKDTILCEAHSTFTYFHVHYVS